MGGGGHGVGQTLTARAARATSWSALEIAGRYGVQFLVTIVLARLLHPADFGLMAMVMVFTSVGTIMVDSGFGTALIQRQHITADDETTVFVFASLVGVIGGVALWAAAPSIALFYRQPDLVPLTRLIAWMLPLSGLAAVPDALLTRRMNFSARAQVQIIASLASGAAAIALAWFGFGVWSIAWQAVVALGLRATLLWFHAHWRPGGTFSREAFGRLFNFGSFVLLGRLLDVGFIRLQALLLGRLFDASTLGYYTLAQSGQQVPASFIGSLLSRVGLPVFSEVSDRPEKLRRALCLSLRVSLFVFFPCMIGLALAAKPLITLIYGARWQAAARCSRCWHLAPRWHPSTQLICRL